jgi:hypothetical protein
MIPRRLFFVAAMLIVVGEVFSSASRAQSPPPAALSQADLEEMLAPIALYPDALLANFLAASVYQDDLKKADAYLKSGGKADNLKAQGIEDPVISIAKVPDAMKMIIDNMEWAEAIGQAYIVQSQDVMAAVQSLRKKAQDNGALKSGQQQTVVTSGDTIIIEQPSPEVVYVPSYDPVVVYQPGYSSSDMFWSNMVSFGTGVAVGAIWANNIDCDWDGGGIGWGHNDVDIDIDREINTGDININRNETNINNVKNKVNSGNRVGNQGTKWQPNSTKVDTNKVKANAQNGSMSKYRGASDANNRSTPKMPGREAGAAPMKSRQPANRANSGGGRTPPLGGVDRSRTPQAPQVDRGQTRAPDRSNNSAARSKPKVPETPKARQSPSGSGFKPDRNAGSYSNRGNASRGGGGRPPAARGGGGGGRGGGRR